jgi:hypothetical protein
VANNSFGQGKTDDPDHAWLKEFIAKVLPLIKDDKDEE